jgi:hypothetical protein
VKLVEPRIYGRNVGIKVKDIFLGLLIVFFQGSDATIKILVVSVGHWGVNGAGGFAQKMGSW